MPAAGEVARHPLFTLLDGLRGEGFPLGVGEYLRALAALGACRADGKDGDPRRLCNYLAPVLCTNPEQQELFHRRFAGWWEEQGGRPQDVEPSPDPAVAPPESERLRPMRPWKWWLTSAAAVAILLAALVWWPKLVALPTTARDLWRSWFVLGTLDVNVAGTGGAPLSGVSLELRNEKGFTTGITDTRGSSRLTFPRGPCRLTATLFGFAPENRIVEVHPEGPPLQLVLAALPRGQLAGRVTDAAGRGLSSTALPCRRWTATLAAGSRWGLCPSGSIR